MEIDTAVAHVARVYDFLLGGTTNFEVDRAAAVQVTAGSGGLETARGHIRANRRFLGRAVRHLAEEGVHQFLDLGAGIPTADNVHEVAQAVAPAARVVYVDDDPVVLAHAHQLLCGTPEGATTFARHDLRDHRAVLAAAADTLDLGRPVAVLLVSMLHLFPDLDDAAGIVRPYVDAIGPGSFLVLSHLAGESDDMTRIGTAVGESQSTNYTLTPRCHDEVARFFTGLDLVDPGLVLVDDWRPDPDPDRSADAEPPGAAPTPFHGGVARKP